MAPRIPDNIDPSELARQLHEQGVILQRLMQNFERMARDGASQVPLALQWTERATGKAQGQDPSTDTLALVKSRDQLREQLKERQSQFSKLAGAILAEKRTIESPWSGRAETEEAKARLAVIQKDHEQERMLIRILESHLDKAERELADALHRESLPSKLAPASDRDSDTPRRS